jgi:Periplasmic binding protein
MVEHKIEAKTWRRVPLLGLIFVATMLWSAAARAQEPIKIGFSVSLTGGLASSGKAHLLSKQIWAEEINAKGGLLGRPVKLVYTTIRPMPPRFRASTPSSSTSTRSIF